MGRLLDLVVLLTAILMFMTIQAASAQMLGEMQTEILAEGIGEEYNAEENFADNFAVVTLWAPLTALCGLTVLIIYREYRRQRVTAVRGLR